ncbi:hypothetical protein ABZ297_35760 [Nonomuraea sp. NPDC005983]|uniref:hypothetical protein n=1 Tax=Nonomuraea sp. NPDC005983 TaxID=3155595 RepID=UPI0033A08722
MKITVVGQAVDEGHVSACDVRATVTVTVTTVTPAPRAPKRFFTTADPSLNPALAGLYLFDRILLSVGRQETALMGI